MKKQPEEMTDNELIGELETQNEWVKDDAFEYVAFGRGDNGVCRDNYIAKLYDEAVKRGLREPLYRRPEDDPDFAEIRAYMEAEGYEWRGDKGDADIFRMWGEKKDGRQPQIGSCSFEDAAQEWHRQFVEQARAINQAEMWG